MKCSLCGYCKDNNCKRQCMELPSGKTCKDCVYLPKCTAVFKSLGTDTHCRFDPILFKERKEK